MIDAVLAMMLTLAALATVATILMECGLRFTRMRKKNLVRVVELFVQEVDKGPLVLDALDRSKLILNVLQNPVLVPDDKTRALAFEGKPQELLKYLGAPEPSEKLSQFFAQLFQQDRRNAIYDKVSTEHVLRKLAAVDSVRTGVVEATANVESELNRLAVKFEEYTSAVSAQYKRNAKAWSMGVGLLVAFGFNVDGVRVFDTYLKDKSLTASVIAEQKELETQGDAAVRQLEAVKAALQELEDAEQAKDPAREADAKAKLDELGEFDGINERYQEARSTIDSLISLGLPIGPDYFPHCLISFPEIGEQTQKPAESTIAGGNGEPTTQTPQALDDIDERCSDFAFSDGLSWFGSVLLTGLLIGLGAPFWFDMAKRLAALRSGVKELAPADERLAARSSNGDTETRKKIVKDVLSDTASDGRDVDHQGEIARRSADKARAGTN